MRQGDELFHMDGRTDVTKLTVVFHNSANASINFGACQPK